MERFVKPGENEALLALIGALDARGAYNRDHTSRSNQVAFTNKLLKCFKIESAIRQQIRNAVLIHDIGMISVPDHILLKPGRLTHDERKIIEHAPQIAGEILAMTPSLAGEREMIIHQNERWDGRGYPDQLNGRHIPIGARFISVAQAIDAMTQDRAYRRARPISYCLQELQCNAGKQFDPAIAKVAASLLCKRKSSMD